MKVAEAALSHLRHLLSLCWQLEEAQLFWARGELDTAKHMMKSLIDVCLRSINSPLVCCS